MRVNEPITRALAKAYRWRGLMTDGSLPTRSWPFLDERKKLILVTAHRRESFGSGFERTWFALNHGSAFTALSVEAR